MPSTPDDVSRPSVRKVERRTIIKAAAWTVPTIVVATASPAAATASGTMAATSASAGPVGNNRDVDFTVTFAGTSPGAHTVTFTSLTSPGVLWTALNGVVKSIPAGGGALLSGPSPGREQSGGATVTINYTVASHGMARSLRMCPAVPPD